MVHHVGGLNMPLNNPAPNFALLTSLDLRGQSGATVFSRSGGSSVVLPTYSSSDVYEDTLFFLNGRISAGALNAVDQLNSASFGTTWDIEINSSDKVIITSDVDFTIRSTGTVDLLGYGTSTINASLTASGYQATASQDWLRGVAVLSDVEYTIEEAGGSGVFTFPPTAPDVQDLTTFIRDENTADADSFSLTSLQELDNTAQSTSDTTWVINDEGYTQCYYTSTTGDITWVSTAIRDLLGFTGDESPIVDGSISTLTSTRQAAGVLVPTRPYQSHHLSVQNVSQSRRMIGGGYVSNYIGTYITSILQFDLDALLDSKDDYRHFTNDFLPLVSGGERINFYQSWGDSRRALITANVNASQDSYDLLYTAEDNGNYGRVRGSLVTADYDLNYPSRLKRRVPVSMEIEHL